MCKGIVKKKVKVINENLNWDSAIADAERMIHVYKAQIAGLKKSIQTFKDRREAGVPFPGSQSPTH